MYNTTRYGRWLALALLSLSSHFAVADDGADRRAIEAASQAWVMAFQARDVEALMRIVADDVVLLDPTLPPVSGRRAVHAAWVQALARDGRALVSTSKEIEIAGNLAWRIATLTRRRINGDGDATQTLEIWQRTGDEWKLRRQMSSGILGTSKRLRSPPEGPMLDRVPN